MGRTAAIKIFAQEISRFGDSPLKGMLSREPAVSSTDILVQRVSYPNLIFPGILAEYIFKVGA